MSEELYCPNCEDYCEFRAEKREEDFVVRGEKFRVPVDLMTCSVCGESIAPDGSEQAVLDKVTAAYRERKGLLSPTEIKAIRQRYALSQRSFASLLGMSEATVNRYEQGKVQDPSHDRLMRACSDPAFIKKQLESNKVSLSDWQRERVEKALASNDSESEIWSEAAEAAELDSLTLMPNEVSEITGYRRFDRQRYAASVAFFCEKLGSIPQTKLNKLLFYMDFLAYKTSTVSLTGAPYRRVQWGPVPATYESLLEYLEAQGIVCLKEQAFPNGVTGIYIFAGPQANTIRCDFTDIELRVLEFVAEEFHSITAKDISERSHQETAWKDTEDKAMISYDTAKDLSLSLPEI